MIPKRDFIPLLIILSAIVLTGLIAWNSKLNETSHNLVSLASVAPSVSCDGVCSTEGAYCTTCLNPHAQQSCPIDSGITQVYQCANGKWQYKYPECQPACAVTQGGYEKTLIIMEITPKPTFDIPATAPYQCLACPEGTAACQEYGVFEPCHGSSNGLFPLDQLAQCYAYCLKLRNPSIPTPTPAEILVTGPFLCLACLEGNTCQSYRVFFPCQGAANGFYPLDQQAQCNASCATATSIPIQPTIAQKANTPTAIPTQPPVIYIPPPTNVPVPTLTNVPGSSETSEGEISGTIEIKGPVYPANQNKFLKIFACRRNTNDQNSIRNCGPDYNFIPLSVQKLSYKLIGLSATDIYSPVTVLISNFYYDQNGNKQDMIGNLQINGNNCTPPTPYDLDDCLVSDNLSLRLTNKGVVNFNISFGKIIPIPVIASKLLQGDKDAMNNKYNLIILPDGYTTIDEFEKDARTTVNAINGSNLGTGIINKMNIWMTTDLNDSEQITQCNSNLGIALCWDYKRAAKIAVSKRGSGYLILTTRSELAKSASGEALGAATRFPIPGATAKRINPYAAVHELGHSIAYLIDEYDFSINAGPNDSDKGSPNCSAKPASDFIGDSLFGSDKSCPKWAGKPYAQQVGCYKVCGPSNWFKPWRVSIMDAAKSSTEVQSKDFNPPSLEAWNQALSGYR